MGIANFLMGKPGVSSLKPKGEQEVTPVVIEVGSKPVKVKKAPVEEGPLVGIHSVAVDMETFEASDENDWLKYLSRPLRTYRKPGVTLKQEHELWFAARARSKASAAVAQAKTEAAASAKEEPTGARA